MFLHFLVAQFSTRHNWARCIAPEIPNLTGDVALKVLPGRYSLFPGFPGRLYDIDPSGERLLVGQSPVARSELAFVLNWDKELERLIPTE